MNPIAILALSVVLAFGAGYGAGHHAESQARDVQDQAAQLAAVKVDQAEKARTAAVSAKVDTAAVQVQADIQQQTRVVHDVVTKYIPVDPGCGALVGAQRVLYDAAASGVPVSGSASPIDDSPGAAQDLARVEVDNLGQCRADLARFGQLQDWLNHVRAP